MRIRLNKFFILGLVASFHLYNVQANAMERDELDVPTLRTKVGHARYLVDEFPMIPFLSHELNSAISSTLKSSEHWQVKCEGILDANPSLSTDQFLCYSKNLGFDLLLNTAEGPAVFYQPEDQYIPLFTICYTQWTESEKIENDKKGLVLLWSMCKGNFSTDGLVELALDSLGGFITYFQEKNHVFYSPSFSNYWGEIVQNMGVTKLDTELNTSLLPIFIVNDSKKEPMTLKDLLK